MKLLSQKVDVEFLTSNIDIPTHYVNQSCLVVFPEDAFVLSASATIMSLNLTQEGDARQFGIFEYGVDLSSIGNVIDGSPPIVKNNIVRFNCWIRYMSYWNAGLEITGYITPAALSFNALAISK